jgi:hypothetical protein
MLHLTSNNIAGPLPDDIFSLLSSGLSLNFNSFHWIIADSHWSVDCSSQSLYMFNNAPDWEFYLLSWASHSK